MKLIARVRLVLDVPFEYEIHDPDETGHSQSRIDAAKYAESELLSRLKLSHENVTIVEQLIEEVRET